MRRLAIIAAVVALCCGTAGATNKYVDETAVGANNGTWGVGGADAWTSIQSIESGLSAGDTVFVRPIHTETLTSSVALTNDGTASNPIVLMGDATHRFWQTAADSAITGGRPVFTPATDYYFDQTSDYYWEAHNLAFDEYTLYCWNGASAGLWIDNCAFTNANHATADYALYLTSNEGTARVTNCIFDGGAIGADDANNYGVAIRAGANLSNTLVDNCTFCDMGTALYSGAIYATNCTFGPSGSDGANTADNGTIQHPGVFIVGGTMQNNSLLSASYNIPVARYYIDASKRPMCYFETGYLAAATSNYTTVHGGGAPYSIEYSVTNTNVGTMNPVRLMEFAVYADSAEVRTYTMSVLRNVGFDAPTAAQLYLEATYQTTDVGGVCTVTTAKSTEVMAGGTTDSTWTDLTVATPANMPHHDGPVMLTLWLKTYDATAGAYLYVDPLLVATGELYHATFNWGLPDLAYNYVPAGGGNRGRIIIVN